MPDPAVPPESRAGAGAASRSGPGSGSRSALAHRAARAWPWIGILLVTGVVQFVRDAPADGALFLIVAGVLVVDTVRPLGSWRRPVVARRLVGWGVAALAVLLLVLLPRHSVGEGIVVVAIGLAVVPFAWPERPASGAPRSSSSSLRRTGVLWAAVALAVCVWELTSFVLGRVAPGGVVEHPAISDLLNPAVDKWWGHALFAAGWLAFGMLLVVPWRRAGSDGERS